MFDKNDDKVTKMIFDLIKTFADSYFQITELLTLHNFKIGKFSETCKWKSINDR